MFPRSKIVIPLFLLLLMSLACGQFSITTFTNIPHEMIIFQSGDEENSELMAYDFVTGEFNQLTYNMASDQYPSFNPVSQKIIFVSDQSGENKLWEIDLKGENLHELTTENLKEIIQPVCSKDGNYIAAAIQHENYSNGQIPHYEIFIMNKNGGALVNLTNNSHSDTEPDWSPDGEKILFVSERNLYSEIYLIDKDGENLKNLTRSDVNDYSPRWSPDGSRIAFVSMHDGPDWDIYVMNSDGTDVFLVTDNLTDDVSPFWSPDGKRIVYTSYLDNSSEIMIVNLNGTNQMRLTHNTINESSPIWISIPPQVKKSGTLRGIVIPVKNGEEFSLLVDIR